ncbi:MAG: nitroreductase family protein [Candidatus Lokiarchaeota archaeon]|nr:nitroreductase family protein [Candidatus Lokiarchaeota archaeon]
MIIIENSKIKIDIDNCTKCKECMKDCVANLFSFDQGLLHLDDAFEEVCIECGHCEAVCPVNVIQLKFHEEEELEPSSRREEFPLYNSFLKLVLNRRSIRRFKEEAIPKDLMEKLLKVGRYSPTGGNEENVWYTVVQDKAIVTSISKHITSKVTNLVNALEDPRSRKLLKKSRTDEEIKLALENLPKSKRKLKMIEQGIDFWCWNGELIIIHGDKTVGGILSNTALAAANIVLAAETLGLGACSLGYLTYFINESQTIKELIKIPDNHVVGYSLTLGYPDVKYKRIPARKPTRVQWF